MFIIFLLRDAPDRIKISSDRDLIRFEVIVYIYSLSFLANTPFNPYTTYVYSYNSCNNIQYTNNTLSHTLYINL